VSPPMDPRLLRPRTPPPRVLYWVGGVDATWQTLGNWFNDAGGTSAATRLPTPRDTAVVLGFCNGNPPTPPVVSNLVVAGSAVLAVTVVVTTLATFTETAAFGSGVTLFGTARFEDTSVLFGDVVGNATFAPTATQCGGVTGTITGTPQPCP